MAAKINIQLTKQQQQMIAVAVVVLGVGGFLYFKQFWIPTSSRIVAAQKAIKDVEAKIAEAEGVAKQKDKIEQQLVVLNQRSTAAEKRLPKAKDVPEVIDTLMSRLSRRYRVEITNWSPGQDSQKPLFTEIPYTVSMTGSYHDIGRFFAAIALEERIYNVRNVAFSGGGTVGASGETKLTVNFTFLAYLYKG